MTRIVSTIAIQAAVCLFAIPTPAFALNEQFEIYNAPSALAMGNAYTADAAGANALFYNPAGLARQETTRWAITPLAIDALFGGGFLTTALGARSPWLDRQFDYMRANPGSYNYMRLNAMASVTKRGFGVALLHTYEFGALSDGSAVDMNYHRDWGVVFGGATNLFSNLIKVGVSVKAINRSELRGNVNYGLLAGPNPTDDKMVEGTGFGADLGAVFTYPTDYLPTIGFTWRDALLGTQFIPTTFFHSGSTGAPQTIAQSFNVGFSVHPVLWRGARGTFSAEIRHLERTDLPLFRKLHLGFQFVTQKKLHLWLGMNQMYPTGGLGLRLRGGDFELCTYAQDIGDGVTASADRRYMLRYTIGF